MSVYSEQIKQITCPDATGSPLHVTAVAEYIVTKPKLAALGGQAARKTTITRFADVALKEVCNKYRYKDDRKGKISLISDTDKVAA